MLILNKKTGDIGNIIRTNLSVEELDGRINEVGIDTELLHSLLKVLDYTVVIYLSNKRGGKLKLTARLISDFNTENNRTKLTEIYSFDLKRNEEDKFINAPDIADTIVKNIPSLIYDHLFKKDNAFFNLLKSSLGSDYRNNVVNIISEGIGDIKTYNYTYIPAFESMIDDEDDTDIQNKLHYEEF